MNKIKIIHVLSSGNYSGAEKVALEIIQKTSGHADAIYFAEEGIISEQIKNMNVRYELCQKMSLKKLNELVEKEKPDVIHAHDFRASLYASLLRGNFRKISHIHQNPPWLFGFNIFTLVFFFICIRANQIVYVGNWYKNSRLFNYIFGGKSHSSPFFIDQGNVKKRSEEDVIGTIESDIIYVGRFSEEKRPSLFISIFARLLRTDPTLKGTMVGAGPLYDECVKDICNRGLSDSIKMTGFSPNPYRYIAKSRVVVIPSKYEGLGLVALEAIILGKKVVVSNVGGLSDNFSNFKDTLCNTEDEFILNIEKQLEDCNSDEYAAASSELLSTISDEQKYREFFISLYTQNSEKKLVF